VKDEVSYTAFQKLSSLDKWHFLASLETSLTCQRRPATIILLHIEWSMASAFQSTRKGILRFLADDIFHSKTSQAEQGKSLDSFLMELVPAGHAHFRGPNAIPRPAEWEESPRAPLSDPLLIWKILPLLSYIKLKGDEINQRVQVSK
jgi:hypothetical protein